MNLNESDPHNRICRRTPEEEEEEDWHLTLMVQVQPSSQEHADRLSTEEEAKKKKPRPCGCRCADSTSRVQLVTDKDPEAPMFTERCRCRLCGDGLCHTMLHYEVTLAGKTMCGECEDHDSLPSGPCEGRRDIGTPKGGKRKISP